jgi:hypothetical protein
MATLNDFDFANRKYDGWQQAEKSITFDGGTTNGIGDFDGTGNPFDIFSVTGDVKMKVVGICTTILAGGGTATLEVGVTGKTAGLIAQTTGTDIDANEIWHDATPDSPIEAASVMVENIVANGLDVIGTVGTANITSGVIKFICLWRALSVDGKVSATL